MSEKLPDDIMLSVVADYPKTEQYKATNIYHLTLLQVQPLRAGVWEQFSQVILAWTFSGSDMQAGWQVGCSLGRDSRLTGAGGCWQAVLVPPPHHVGLSTGLLGVWLS